MVGLMAVPVLYGITPQQLLLEFREQMQSNFKTQSNIYDRVLLKK